MVQWSIFNAVTCNNVLTTSGFYMIEFHKWIKNSLIFILRHFKCRKRMHVFPKWFSMKHKISIPCLVPALRSSKTTLSLQRERKLLFHFKRTLKAPFFWKVKKIFPIKNMGLMKNDEGHDGQKGNWKHAHLPACKE